MPRPFGLSSLARVPARAFAVVGALAAAGLVLAAVSCGSGVQPTRSAALDFRYEGPGSRQVPPELASNWVACVHTAAPLTDKLVRLSWGSGRGQRAGEAQVPLQPVGEANVYSGRLTDAPVDAPVRLSVVDLDLCSRDPLAFPPLATDGMSVNGTALTHVVEDAPLGRGFVFTPGSDGTITQ